MGGRRRSSMVVGLLLVVALVSSRTSPFFSSAELQKLEHPMKSDGSLSLLAVGDWGRNGTFNQSQVAFQMGRIGEELDVDFVISVGDNFYENGLASIDDRSFMDDFTNVYTAKSLQKQWYAVLGNHDYMGNVLAQLDPALQKIDSRWLCKRSFTVDAGVAEFFFVDTSPFVKKYWKIPNKHHYDWRGVAPRKNYISKLLTDLDTALAVSTATWKIVVGHHAIRSVGENGDTKELVKKLLPILENHGVDLYINGHDHCLEQISSRNSPIQFITSGGGSKAWAGIFNPSEDKLRFFYDGQGFISLQLAKADAKVVFYDVLVVFYDVFGAVRHQWSFTRQFKSI